MVILQDRTSWLNYVLALVLAAAAWTVWSPALRNILASHHDALPDQVNEEFDNGVVTPGRDVNVSGYHACAYGWCLAPGASGTLTWHFVASGEQPILHVWLYRPRDGTTRISVSTDGASWRVVSENGSHERAMASVDLGVPVRPGQELALRVEATNPGDGEVLVLDKLTIVYPTAKAPLPPAWAVFAMVLSFGLAVVMACQQRTAALVTVLILALGAALRYGEAMALVGAPLEPDALGYRVFARKMVLFSETGFFSARFDMREPLFILLNRGWFLMFGESAFGMRILNVALSTLAIWGVLRLGRLLFGHVPGQVIGLLVALNGPLIHEPARALRLELELVLVTAYFALAFATAWRRLVPAAVLLSTLGVLLVFTRSTYLPVVLVLNAYALYRPGRLVAWIGALAVTVGILAACVAPYRYNMYRVYNDPFYDTATYARWIANMEFAGKPGFPTPQELEKNGYLGPPITYRDYMLGMHTKAELVVGTVRGFVKLIRGMLVFPWLTVEWPSVRRTVDLMFQVLAVAGFLVALSNPAYRWIPLAFVLLEFPVAFLYDRGLVEAYRHSYSAFPLVLYAATLGLTAMWGRWQARGGRHATITATLR